MSGLADFLKGTVDESLKKLISPSAIVPGALFVLLTLAFVYPEARAHGVGVANDFHELSGAWQAVVAGAAILVIGYVVGSASGSVLDTLSGRTWDHSISYRLLSKFRGWRRGNLNKRIAATDDAAIEPIAQAKWRRVTRFAPEERRPAPSALGDVLLATDGLAEARFGMVPLAMWEPMRAALPEDDTAAKIAGEQKAVVDLMAGLWLAFTAFFVECAVLFSLWGKPTEVLLALLVLPPAYLAYRVTVTKTLSWGDGVLNVFALRHEALREALGLRESSSPADRRKLWKEASQFMLFEPSPTSDAIYEPEAVQMPTVRSTANLDVQTDAQPLRREASGSTTVGMKFVLRVTASDSEGEDTIAGDVHVSDPRVVRIPDPPQVESSGAGIAVEVMSAPNVDVSDTVLLHVTGLAPANATTLRFELTRWRLEIDKSLRLEVEERTGGTLRVTVVNPAQSEVTDATLRLFHVLDGRDEVQAHGHGNKLTGGTLAATERCWSVPRIGKSESFRFTVDLKKKKEETS